MTAPTLLLHLSDLLNWVSLSGIMLAMKQSTYSRQYADGSNAPPQPFRPRLPFVYILVVVAGAIAHAAGFLYPGAPQLSAKIQQFLAYAASNGDEVSQHTIILHMVNNSELTYTLLLLTFKVVFSLSLLLQYVMALGAEKVPQKPARVVGSFVTLVLVITCAAAIGGTVYGFVETPKAVKANSIKEIFPLLPNSLPHRFGLFSLLEVAILVRMPSLLWKEKENQVSPIAFAVFCNSLSLILFIAQLVIKSEYKLLDQVLAGSMSHRVHMTILLAHCGLITFMFLPGFVRRNYLTCIAGVALVAVIIGGLESPDYATLLASKENHMMLNSSVFLVAGLCTVVGGTSSCLAALVFVGAFSKIHEKMLEKILV